VDRKWNKDPIKKNKTNNEFVPADFWKVAE